MLKLRHFRRARTIGAAMFVSAALAPQLSARTVDIEFVASNFPTPLVIDNQYWPLVSGTYFVYRAGTPDGCEWSEVTVSNEAKEITIGGDTLFVRVVQDFEYEDEDCGGIDDDELVEKTFDWYGQDRFGNIWYFGEDTQDCEGAEDCEPGEGRWEAGKDIQGSGTIAEPGIIMLATPAPGERYRQEFYDDFAEDWGMVMNLNGKPRLRIDDAYPPGEWNNCLVTKEWNDLEPGSVEQKTYCPGVGLVLVEEHSGPIVRFELTDPNELNNNETRFHIREWPRR